MKPFLIEFLRHIVWGLKGLYRSIKFLATPIRRQPLLLSVMVALQAVCEWQQSRWGEASWLHLEEVLVDAFPLCLVLTLLPRKVSRWMRPACYVAAYMLAVFEVFLTKRFGMNFSPTALQLFRETTPEETREFFSAYLSGEALWQTVGAFVPVLLLNVLLAWRGRTVVRRLKISFYGAPVLNVLALAAFAFCIVETWPQKKKMFVFFSQTSSQQLEKVEAETFYSPFWRLMYSYHMLGLASDELEVLRQNMRKAEVEGCSFRCPNIVLVIGESYNKHHAQIYGYEKETTPHMMHMMKQGRLIPFDNVVTVWNLTSNVFKNMFSTHSIDQKGNWSQGVLFPALFRKAGYRVAFLTNQFKNTRNQNTFDFNGSFFLNDAEIDTLSFDFRNKNLYRYDGDFIKEYEAYRPAQHNLIIFHLYGQHQKYSYRLRPQDRYFTEDSVKRNYLSRKERRILADYDNATRCNDGVFAEICNYFKSKDAIVVYVADHGEEVYDHSHIMGRSPADPLIPIVACYEFEVPMTVWLSPKFIRRHRDVVKEVKAAQFKPFMTDDLPHMLLGLAGIRCKEYEARRDLLSPDFNAGRKRMVKGKYDIDQLLKGTKFEHHRLDEKPSAKKKTSPAQSKTARHRTTNVQIK